MNPYKTSLDGNEEIIVNDKSVKKTLKFSTIKTWLGIETILSSIASIVSDLAAINEDPYASFRGYEIITLTAQTISKISVRCNAGTVAGGTLFLPVASEELIGIKILINNRSGDIVTINPNGQGILSATDTTANIATQGLANGSAREYTLSYDGTTYKWITF